MGRKSDARERILDTACTLIHHRGYSGLGVAEICSTAGVPKGSFYYFFESKQALAVTVINEYWAVQRRHWEGTLIGDKVPLDRLRDLFEATAEQARSQQETGAVKGCMFANLALELSAQDDVVREILQQVFEEQIDLIHGVIAEAIEAGDVPSANGSRSIARSVLAQIEGLVLFAKVSNDPKVLDDMWRHMLLLLGAGKDIQIPA